MCEHQEGSVHQMKCAVSVLSCWLKKLRYSITPFSITLNRLYNQDKKLYKQHKRAGKVTNPDDIEAAKHEDAANYEKAIIELFLSADDDKDGARMMMVLFTYFIINIHVSLSILNITPKSVDSADASFRDVCIPYRTVKAGGISGGNAAS